MDNDREMKLRTGNKGKVLVTVITTSPTSPRWHCGGGGGSSNMLNLKTY